MLLELWLKHELNLTNFMNDYGSAIIDLSNLFRLSLIFESGLILHDILKNLVLCTKTQWFKLYCKKEHSSAVNTFRTLESV